MITINLLPIGAFKEKFKGRVFLAGYGIFMLIAIAALFSFKTNVMDDKLEGLRSDQNTKQSELAALKKKVTEATLVTNNTVRLWRQLMAILELEDRRRDQTRLLVELEGLLPKSNAWFLSLVHNNGALTINAISTDKETVSQFLTRLENAVYIDRQSVNLVEIAQNMVINGIKLTRFKITAKTAFPQPKIMEAGLPELGLPGREEFLKTVEAVAPQLIADIKSNAAKSGKAL